MSNAHILVQDLNDNWITVQVIQNVSKQYVFSVMKEVQSAWQGKRVRAEDDQGRLIDLL
jgi:hypothetical protein